MARKMKDSGVEWIGQIPEDWEIRKNKYLIHTLYSGGTPTASNPDFYTQDGIPFVSISDMSNVNYVETTKKSLTQEGIEDKNLKVLDEGTILYSIYATIGVVSELKIKSAISQAILAISTKDVINKQFYKYNLIAMRDYIFSTANGNTQFNLNAEKVWNFIFTFPKLMEQQKIADFLDEKVVEIDNIIAKTKESIEEYKKYKQAVITETVTKGLDKTVPMKDSGIDYIGFIPINWKIIPIGIAFDFIGGYAYKSEKFCDETTNQVIRLGNVKNDNFILNEKQIFIDDEYAEESVQALIKVDDILFTMTGTKGKGDYFYTLIVKEEHLKNKKLFLNQRVGCFRKSINDVYMPYYDYLLKYDKIRDYIFLGETGSANQGNIGIEYVNTLKLQLPDYDEQKEIANYLDKKCIKIDNLIFAKEQLIVEMENYKKSLIYEYVTGKKETI